MLEEEATLTWDATEENVDRWRLAASRFQHMHRQTVRVTGCVDARTWRNVADWLANPLGYDDVAAVPLDDLDGCRPLRADVLVDGACVCDNEPFYLRTRYAFLYSLCTPRAGARVWGSNFETSPPLVQARHQWEAGPLWRSPASPDATLWSASDPWLVQTAALAATQGQRLVWLYFNFAADDHGTRSFGVYDGQEKRSSYAWFPSLGQSRPTLHTVTVTDKGDGEAPCGTSLLARYPAGLRCVQGCVLIAPGDVDPAMDDVGDDDYYDFDGDRRVVVPALIALLPGRCTHPSPLGLPPRHLVRCPRPVPAGTCRTALSNSRRAATKARAVPPMTGTRCAIARRRSTRRTPCSCRHCTTHRSTASRTCWPRARGSRAGGRSAAGTRACATASRKCSGSPTRPLRTARGRWI